MTSSIRTTHSGPLVSAGFGSYKRERIYEPVDLLSVDLVGHERIRLRQIGEAMGGAVAIGAVKDRGLGGATQNMPAAVNGLRTGYGSATQI